MRDVRLPQHPVRGLLAAPSVVLAMLAVAPIARAQDAEGMGGHLSLGYSQLFITDSPGGSLSVAAGVDYPIADRLRLGAGVGFALLGSRALEAGTAVANLDYSAFEASAMLVWSPEGWGPIGRIGVGPALVSARAELSTSGGGLVFTPEAIEEIAPGIALDVTLMSQRPSLVRAGLEIGVRHAFLDRDSGIGRASESWTIGSLRLAIHY